MAVLSSPTATGAMGPADWCRSQWIISAGDKITGGLNVAYHTGRTVRVDAGTGVVGGIAFTNVGTEYYTSDLESSSNSRLDRLVARKTWPSLAVEFAILKGAPAVTPQLPALTQDHGGVWEFGLGYWEVPANNGNTIVAGNVWAHYANTHHDEFRNTTVGDGTLAATATILSVPDVFRVPGEGVVEIEALLTIRPNLESLQTSGAVSISALGQSVSRTFRTNYVGPVSASSITVPVRLRAKVPAGGGKVATFIEASCNAGESYTVTHVSADLLEIMP